MRPTNLGFKSPREVCQAPHYNPTVTSKGAKLAYVSVPNKPVKQRPKSNLSSRFYEQPPSGNTSVFLGPGKYKDDYNSISHTIKSKVHAKYKGDMIDSRSSPYTYAGDAKVLDLAFLSPQARKAAYPYVITTSINLTSPKVGTPTSVGTLGNQSTAYSCFPHKRSPSNGSNGLKFQGQHHRTRSMQADGAKAPWEKILSSVGQGSGDQMLRTHSRKGSVELTKAQKDRNEQIYSQLVDSQLSKDLKSLKKELEGFQKKKVLRDTHMYDTKQNWSSTEGTETQKVTESEKEELETDKLTISDKENGNGYIQIQEHIQAQEPRQEQEERRALVETSSNTCSLRGPDISFDGEGFITMNLASPKFGTNEFKSRQKEQKNLPEQKSFNKAIESKRKAVVTLANSSNVHSVSYHSRSGSMTSKAVRKI